MTTLQLIHDETGKMSAPDGEQCTVYESPSQTDLPPTWGSLGSFGKGVRFFRNLSTKAIHDFESLAKHFCWSRHNSPVQEEQLPSSIILLIRGRVKLSMNSGDGRRLIVRIAEPGEILGLASAVSGSPYNITAEAQFPCVFSSIDREGFLDFLVRYQQACCSMWHAIHV